MFPGVIPDRAGDKKPKGKCVLRHAGGIDLSRILKGTGSGKNRNSKIHFSRQKNLVLAGMCILCLLAGCARKESGQTESEWENLTETSSAEAWDKTTPPAEITAVLTDVLYDKRQMETSKPITVQFLFSDGDSVERKLDDTFGEVYHMYVDYDDMTGDGTEEVVIHRYTDVAGERYSVLDIFRMDGKEIWQLFPVDDMEGLEGNICEEDVFMVDRNGRRGNGLHVKIYGEGSIPDKSGAKVLQVAEEMDLFYEDGKWLRLPERELHVEVSLESDSPEARLYEAFLKGECEAVVSGQYYSGTSYLDPVPEGQESFSFQEMLNTIVSGIREDAALDGMERVECALVDCGSDGRPELAVRAYGVGIWGGRDDGNGEVVMIFRCRDGRVELIYSLDCWARSYADIYINGYVSGGGSGGAMTHYIWEGIIGADGVYREYSLHIETKQGLYGMTGYKAVGDEMLPAEFYECTLGDETIYGYYIEEDIPEDVRENVMAYIAENEEKMGAKFMPYEEMDRQIDKWAGSIGITAEMRERVSWEAEGIAWQTVEGCEDYLCGQQEGL